MLFILIAKIIHARVIPLKDKKGITITNTFQKILKESNHKSSKIGSEFSNISMKSWLEKNDMENLFLLKDLLEP